MAEDISEEEAEKRYREANEEAARAAGYTVEYAAKLAEEAVRRRREHMRPWLRPEPVCSVWLDREGEYIVVRVQKADGKYYQAIREHQESHFSHSITAEGIRGLTKPVQWPQQEGQEGE